MLRSSLRFAPAKVNVEKRPDGSIVLRSPQKLGAYARCVTEWLVHWSDHSPNRIFLAERSGDGWRRFSYRESYGAVRRIGQALLNLGLNQERPVAILSDNSIDHALLALGAMHVGVPVVAGAGSNSTKEAVDLAQTLARPFPGVDDLAVL